MNLGLINPNDPHAVRRAFQTLQRSLGFGSTPTFIGLTLTGLTATRLMQTNASKGAASVTNLANWVAGTANEVNVADDGDGTITIGLVDPVIVSKGGTGAATLTDHGLLLGSGTDAITPLGAATDGQLPIGSTGLDPVLATLTGTTNRVTVTNGAGSITLSGPQDIHTAATPTFAGLTLTGKTGVLWSNAGVVTGDATLDLVGALAANKTFNNAAFSLSFNFTNPTNQPTYDGAFEIQASGAFAGDLFHVHQHTGNPGATDLCHFEAEDADVTVLRLQHDVAGANCLEVGASGAIKLRITDDGGIFVLEKVADLTDVAGYGQLWVRNDTPNNLCFTDDTGVVYELSHNLTTDIDHDALTNFAADEHFLQTAITNVSTALSTGLLKVTTGTGALSAVTDNSSNWNTAYGWGNHASAGYLTSPVAIANGGTGQTTAQAAIDALSAVAAATNEHVLTKDTATGNAKWKAAAGGGNAFGTITGITNDVVADAAADTVTFATGNDKLTIVGTAASDTVTFTVGAHKFVDRGDPVNPDWTETGSKAVLNTDNTWRDLDCSSIVPAGAVAILFVVAVRDDAADSRFSLRKNGNTNTTNRVNWRTQVSNILVEVPGIVACDSNRVVEYNGDNLAFSLINVTIGGWWI